MGQLALPLSDDPFPLRGPWQPVDSPPAYRALEVIFADGRTDRATSCKDANKAGYWWGWDETPKLCELKPVGWRYMNVRAMTSHSLNSPA